MTDKNRIFAAAIVGPTGVGKTKTSVLLAKKINAQIVSADSMQIYKNMDIGTAKASEDEMCGVKHYMLSVAEPWEEYNVVRYVSEAKEAVNEIFENGFFPLVVGGTGLYADALLNGTDFSVTAKGLFARWKFITLRAKQKPKTTVTQTKTQTALTALK